MGGTQALPENIWGVVGPAHVTPPPVASRGDVAEGARFRPVDEGVRHSAGIVPQWDDCQQDHLADSGSDP